MRDTSSEGSADANPRGVDVNLRSGPQMREYEGIADRIAAQRLAPVLDWGCGWGQVTDLLVRRGVVVESFDYRDDEPPRVVALERFEGIEAHVSGDPVRLPFPDDHFAAVLSCGVLEHVQYPEASLGELHRVLRPGGRLLIYKLPNRFSYLEALARGLGLYYHGKLPNDRVYDRGRVTALLSRHGFRVDEFRRANMLPLTIAGGFGWRHRDRIWRLNRLLAEIPVVNFIATSLEVGATATGKDVASRPPPAHP
jgi:SAM-dependent methyltransferase